MDIFFDTLITLFIASLIVVSVWLSYGRFVTPLKAGKGERLYAIIYAGGSAPNLDQTVNTLLGLLSRSRIEMEVVIADGGLDAESRKMAELLTRGTEGVSICKASELDIFFKSGTEEE